MKYSDFFLMLLPLFLTLTGCTTAICEESLKQVDNSFNFGMFKENPDKYIGSYILMGGCIASVNNTKQGGEL